MMAYLSVNKPDDLIRVFYKPMVNVVGFLLSHSQVNNEIINRVGLVYVSDN